jgi:hypothetical protein
MNWRVGISDDSVVDPHHLDADQNADLDHPDADPDSYFHLVRIRIFI